MAPDPIIAAIEVCPLFAGLDLATQHDLARVAQQRTVLAGQFVMRKGEPGDALFVVVSGRLEAVTTVGDRVMLLSSIQAPNAIGEIAALDGGPRTADVIAETPATLLRIPRAELMSIIRRYPALAERVIEFLCQRVRWTSESVEDAALRDLRSRLARRLLAMEGEGGLVEPVTQQRLAEMLGTQREVVHRILRDFRAWGIVGGTRGRLRVLDGARLKEIGDG